MGDVGGAVVPGFLLDGLGLQHPQCPVRPLGGGALHLGTMDFILSVVRVGDVLFKRQMCFVGGVIEGGMCDRKISHRLARGQVALPTGFSD